MVLSDEKIVHYWVPTMKLETYTRNSIFEKKFTDASAVLYYAI